MTGQQKVQKQRRDRHLEKQVPVVTLSWWHKGIYIDTLIKSPNS